MKAIWPVVLALWLGGCVSSPSESYQPTRVEVSFPELGDVTRASLGEDMMVQGYETSWAGIILENRVSFGLTGAYGATPGEYKLIGTNDDELFYLPTDGMNSGSVVVSPLADPFKHLMINNNGKLCGVSIYNLSVCTSEAKYQKTDVGGLGLDSFQQTLIYSGRVGDKIRLTYREFSGGRIRDAFSNDVEYDLSQSNIIGYKGAEVEVLEATNNYIQFRLLKNF